MFPLILLVILTIYILAHYALGRFLAAGCKDGSPRKKYVLPVVLTGALLYPAGRTMEAFYYARPVEIIMYIGAVWMGFAFYLGICALAWKITELVGRLFGRFDCLKKWRMAVVVMAFVITLAGMINARIYATRELDFPISGLAKEIKIVYVSDVHLGALTLESDLRRLIALINKQAPDVVLVGGDLVDEDMQSVLANGHAREFEALNAPLGVYAVTGNHEYFGDVDAIVSHFARHGVFYLRDEVVLLDGQVYLAGRNDRGMRQKPVSGRSSLHDMLDGLDPKIPLVVADHRPDAVKEAVAAGADLLLCGHTHRGQLWPFHFVTHKIFGHDYGLRLVKKTAVYISSGSGTWGPPMRTTSRPEIVVIKLVPRNDVNQSI